MFEFEKFFVYQKSVQFYSEVRKIKFQNSDEDRILARQLNRAALSVPMNIAEGIGRFTPKDRRNFMIISRGSLYESISILSILNADSRVKKEHYDRMYSLGSEISKMLYALISKLEKDSRSV